MSRRRSRRKLGYKRFPSPKEIGRRKRQANLHAALMAMYGEQKPTLTRLLFGV